MLVTQHSGWAKKDGGLGLDAEGNHFRRRVGRYVVETGNNRCESRVARQLAVQNYKLRIEGRF